MTLFRREAAAYAGRHSFDHTGAAGGIVIGKRLSENRIAILAASGAGPQADNHDLGFALDPDHANTVLQEWFARDPDADFAGLWHVHPRWQNVPTDEDLEAARKLFADPDTASHELVSAILIAGQDGPILRCFYLSREGALAGQNFTLVPYEEVADDAPVLLGGALESTPPPPVVEAVAAPLPPLPVAPSRPPSRILLFVGVAAVLLLVLAAAVALGGSGRDGTGTATPSPANASAESDPVAVAGATTSPEPTTLLTVPDTTATVDTSDTTATAEAVPPATPTTVEEPQATTTPPSEPTIAPTEVSTPEPPTVAPAATPTSSLPFTLRFEPMTAAATTRFVERARAAGCAICYNIDLIGPAPFVELRIKVAGTNRVLELFPVPSLVELAPRAEPYTLQAFDAQDEPVSDPVRLTVVEGNYYVLRVTGQEQ